MKRFYWLTPPGRTWWQGNLQRCGVGKRSRDAWIQRNIS